MSFEFSTPTEIVFGRGTLARSGSLAARWGRRAFVVTGRGVERAAPLRHFLNEASVEHEVFSFAGEPSTDLVDAAVLRGKTFGAQMVIGFGGGSAMDAAKAVAGLSTNAGAILEHLEVVGAGRPLVGPALPWMAIPTTAGTGAEVTRNAVLTVPSRQLKVSLRSPLLFARTALIDPDLTAQLPRSIAAASGLDALTQLIEAYVCTRANPMTDALCESGIRRAARALPLLAQESVPSEARIDMAWASLASGIALSNAGLGAVHGLASPIGGRYDAPHGAICAALLAPVMTANIAALRDRVSAGPGLSRYRDVARWTTQRPDAEPEEGVNWVRARVSALGLSGLGTLGLRREDCFQLSHAALAANSMKANPVTLSAEELVNVLLSAT